MSRWTNLLLDVNYMKQYAAGAARVVTIGISRLGVADEQRMQDAAMARYQLDQLLLNEESKVDKWAQWRVEEPNGETIFTGTKSECKELLIEGEIKPSYGYKIRCALPDDVSWCWNRYFKELRKRCGIEFEFIL